MMSHTAAMPSFSKKSQSSSSSPPNLSSALVTGPPETSPTSPANPPTTILPGFPDHYAILRLGPSASTADIKAAYRTLRVEYFKKADAGKYRALQAAFVMLVDGEARSAYDRVWRDVMGVETSEFSASISSSRPLRVANHVQRLNAKLGLVVDTDIKNGTAEHREDEMRKEKAEAEALLAHEQEAARNEHEVQQEWDKALKLEREEQTKKEAEMEKKARITAYKPVIGTKPYHSYIPIAIAYGDKKSHPSLFCWRPQYVLWRAKMSLP